MKIIEFTDKAIDAVKSYKNQLQIPEDYFLRVGVKQKNETNKRLVIGFDTKTEKDMEVEVSGIKVVYSPGEVFFFVGMKIDYVELGDRKGFTFVEHKVLAT